MNKYKIYCETDGWVEVIASAEPTVCPIDNTHTLREGSAVITEQNVSAHDGEHTEISLIDYKKLKFNAIDTRTKELVSEGFTYGGKVFSMSNNAQLNLLGVDIKRNDGILPITFNTIDDMDDMEFTTAADIDAFFMTGLGTKKAHLDSGSALKILVRVATTEAEIDAVIDNR